MNLTVIFLDENGDSIDISLVGIMVDFASLSFGTEMGKGESDATIVVYAESNDSLPVKAFNQSVKKILIFLDTQLIWSGVAKTPEERPEFDEGQRKLTVRFTGYYVLFSRRKIAKVWVDKVATKRTDSPIREELQNRGILAKQDEGKRDIDGLVLKTTIAQDDTVYTHGDPRFVVQYKSINGEPIQAIKGKWWARSGEGMEGAFWNYEYGIRFLKYDVSNTGDQTNVKSITINQTNVTGGDTSIVEYRTGTSLTELNGESVVIGTGTDEIANTLRGSLGYNSLILTFNKVSTKDIFTAAVELASGGEYRAQAAIYTITGNFIQKFDNEVILSQGVTKCVFIKSGGIAFSGASGAYALVVRIDNTTNDVSITTVGLNSVANPPTGYTVNGYLFHNPLTGTYPAFPNASLPSVGFNTTWVKLEFGLDVTTQDIWDQNDYTKLEFTIFSKYHPTHSAYLNPSYTGTELIEDVLKTAVQEISYDPALIPSGINNDLPFDAIGEVAAIPVGDMLEKIYGVYNLGKLYPQVWAYGGSPVFELIQRSDAVQITTYSINTTSQNITVKTNNTVDLINYVFIRFTDERGQSQIISPNEYPSLADGDALGLGLNRKDYYYDAGEVSLAEALQAGEGIIQQFKAVRESGQVTIVGPDGVVSYSEKDGIGIHPATLKATQKIVLAGFVASDGTPDPCYQIIKTRYQAGSQKMDIWFGDPSFSQSVFESLKKRVGSNK